MSGTTDPLTQRDTPSSVLHKLSADLRKQVDRALADRDPPAIKDVFEKFGLSEKGVGRSAFYRYARRVRMQTLIRDLADLADDDHKPVFDLLPALLGHRLLDALADESASPRAVLRLTDAWRAAVRTSHDLEIHQVKLAAVKKRENLSDIDDIAALVKRYGKFVAEDNRNRFADARAAIDRAAQQPPGESEP